jgi:hypothetical protein
MARGIRRSAFATPFVLVIGCGRQPAPEEPRDVDEDEVVASGPVADARPPLHFIDAGPPDAEQYPDADPAEIANREAHCSGRLKPVWNCNPPPPPDPDATGNPPGPIAARVINLTVVADGCEVVFNKGSADGIDTGWKGFLVNENGKKVFNSDFVIDRVNERTSRARIQLTADQIQAAARAKLQVP